MNETNILILAGGLGTRLKEITQDTPKILANINNQPFIYFVLDLLSDQNIKKITLCVGYKHEDIKSILKNKYKEIDIIYSTESTQLGTAGAIRNALNKTDTSTTIILNGDTFCQININELYEYHNKKKSDFTIVVNKNKNPNAATICLDKNNKIKSYAEKNEGNKGNYISAGVYILQTKLITEIPINKNTSLEYDIIPCWISKYKCYAYCNKSEFIDIGTPDTYNKFKNDYNKNSI